MTSAADNVWTFADFRCGHVFGTMPIVLDSARLERWRSIYGVRRSGAGATSSSEVPRGLLVTCMMEAYLGLVQPRPPGNIHAGQKVAFRSGGAQIGDTLKAHLSCTDKFQRKGRGWVHFRVSIDKEEDALLCGEIRTIWAK